MFAILKKTHLLFYLDFSHFLIIGWVAFFLLTHMSGLSQDTVVEYLPIFCPFKFATGISCPGCGMTRAFLAIAEADFISAFHHNPFSIPFFILTVLSALNVRISFPEKTKAYFYTASLIIVLLWWVWARLVPEVFT